MKYFISVLFCLLVFPMANAQPRTALVIGNSNYKLMPLSNPANDATDIAAKLKTLGFQVFFATDQSKVGVKRLIREFGQSLKRNGGMGLFFYAGHGLQIEGENYLVPVDFNTQEAYEVTDQTVNIGLITGAMEAAGNPVNIIVLDACRDNPFPRKTRSASRGLARLDSGVSSSSLGELLIAYSTGPGDVAKDGDGRNSPYTEYLLKYIGTPGLTIEQVFKKVKGGVKGSSRGQQLPWEMSSLINDYYFVPGEVSAVLNSPVITPRPQPVRIQPAPQPVRPRPVPKPETPSNLKKLTIFTNPEGSTVTLLDSDIPYSRGVKLEPGDYRVEIRKEGYITKKKWVNIDTEDLSVQITLARD